MIAKVPRVLSPLSDLADRQPAVVAAVNGGDAVDGDRARELAEIGFVAGEPVMIVARGWPGGDPLVVRIGLSTFALRRSEAALVQVLTP